MRHRIAGYKLNVTKDHRRAMLRNLAAGLFEHGLRLAHLQRFQLIVQSHDYLPGPDFFPFTHFHLRDDAMHGKA